MTKPIRIFAMMREDIHTGVVWLNLPGLPARGIVKISNPSADKTIYCEAMQIDKNFRRAYNRDGEGRMHVAEGQQALVIGYWHRQLLGGIPTKADAQLAIEYAGRLGKFRACFQHPQIVVRIAT